jgi:membrane protein insertase Oxa1/YidC/SpoIIIJ
MPGMMLVMFYSMPAALSLYWTVSQGISILQMLLQRYRDKIKRDGEGAIVVEPPDTTTRQMRRRQTR